MHRLLAATDSISTSFQSEEVLLWSAIKAWCYFVCQDLGELNGITLSCVSQRRMYDWCKQGSATFLCKASTKVSNGPKYGHFEDSQVAFVKEWRRSQCPVTPRIMKVRGLQLGDPFNFLTVVFRPAGSWAKSTRGFLCHSCMRPISVMSFTSAW